MKRKNSQFKIDKGILFFLLILVLSGCNWLWDAEIERWEPESDKLVIADYVEQFDSTNKFSQFDALLKSTRLNSLLKIRGPFTLFLPNDDAMSTYCQELGVNAVTELEMEAQKNLVYNHIIQSIIYSDDIGLGAISTENGLGDRIATHFGDDNEIYLNLESKIVDRDIKAANGMIHEIDRVMDPLSLSVYDELASNPGYSIFTKGLELTGIKDTFQIIDFEYGLKVARNEFTVLAVADTTFNRFGIGNVDDLIQKYADGESNYTDDDNGLYRYMEYHCLKGTHYFSDFQSQLYPILSYNNNVKVEVGADFRINPDTTIVTTPDTIYVEEHFTTLNLKESNVPAKNGVIHSITDLLPYEMPSPTSVIFEVTDYFDLKQGEYYQNYFYKWYDGENDLEHIKWRGDYLQYHYKPTDAWWNMMNNDCLQMFGYFWLEVTTPKVMKGKYKLMANLIYGIPDHEVWVDGVKIKTVTNAPKRELLDWGTYEWDETTTHTIRFENISWGMIFWDYLEFVPVED